jgi:hypothetical protein
MTCGWAPTYRQRRAQALEHALGHDAGTLTAARRRRPSPAMMVMAECTESAVASLEMSTLPIGLLRPAAECAACVRSRSTARSMAREESVEVENIEQR